MIEDKEIYEFEAIIDEISDLIDRAENIVNDSDDYIIIDNSGSWIEGIRKNIRNKTRDPSAQATLDELWEDWNKYGDMDD